MVKPIKPVTDLLATQSSFEEPYQPSENDIIDDLLCRVIALAPAFSAALAAQVDKDVRSKWGGDRVYIGSRSGRGASARNANIKRDYMNGEHFDLLERRYGLSRSRLCEIIKS